MNEVSLDDAALAAEADAALAAAPAPDVSVTVSVPALESWVGFVGDMMPAVRIGLVPQWNITDQESAAFSESLGTCLDQLFPGGPTGKYACWVRLFGTCSGIALGRYLANGALPPLGPKRADEPAKPEAH